jgi:hypothetical protein
MVAINMSTSTSAEIVQKLNAKDSILKDHYAMLRALRARIRENESKFGVPANEVHMAIDDGRIDETFDVTQWIMDIDLLDRIERAGR